MHGGLGVFPAARAEAFGGFGEGAAGFAYSDYGGYFFGEGAFFFERLREAVAFFYVVRDG